MRLISSRFVFLLLFMPLFIGCSTWNTHIFQNYIQTDCQVFLVSPFENLNSLSLDPNFHIYLRTSSRFSWCRSLFHIVDADHKDVPIKFISTRVYYSRGSYLYHLVLKTKNFLQPGKFYHLKKHQETLLSFRAIDIYEEELSPLDFEKRDSSYYVTQLTEYPKKNSFLLSLPYSPEKEELSIEELVDIALLYENQKNYKNYMIGTNFQKDLPKEFFISPTDGKQVWFYWDKVGQLWMSS